MNRNRRTNGANLQRVKRVEATTSPCITHRKRQKFLQNPVIRATQFYLALQRKTAQVRDQLPTTYPMCKIQALSCNKMRVLTALLDFPNAARAEVFTDRLSLLRRNASLRLTGKRRLEEEVPDALRLGHPGE